MTITCHRHRQLIYPAHSFYPKTHHTMKTNLRQTLCDSIPANLIRVDVVAPLAGNFVVQVLTPAPFHGATGVYVSRGAVLKLRGGFHEVR